MNKKDNKSTLGKVYAIRKQTEGVFKMAVKKAPIKGKGIGGKADKTINSRKLNGGAERKEEEVENENERKQLAACRQQMRLVMHVSIYIYINNTNIGNIRAILETTKYDWLAF